MSLFNSMNLPWKVTSHPPTALWIMFKEYEMEIHQPRSKFYTRTAVFKIIAHASFLKYDPENSYQVVGNN